MSRPKKQFCPKGHDTFIVGRDKQRRCKGCIAPVSLGIKRRKRKQFCPRGHDTFVYGRNELNYRCNICLGEDSTDYKREHKAEISIRNHKYHEEHKDIRCSSARQYYIEHRKEILEIKKALSKILVEYVKQWRKVNPDKVRAFKIKQETNRSLRVVAWTDWDNIAKFELNKPKGMTTDHVIPLQGDEVSGLHVSWNLQYLTLHQNSSKGNRINLVEASEWYGKILEEVGLK